MFKGLAIFLSLIVAFAVGICPCGMNVLVARAGGELVRSNISTPATHACCLQKGSDKPSHPCNDTDPQKCASTVSADVPGGHAVAPIVHSPIAILIASIPLTENSAQMRHSADAVAGVCASPPPTLLALSCSFNI